MDDLPFELLELVCEQIDKYETKIEAFYCLSSALGLKISDIEYLPYACKHSMIEDIDTIVRECSIVKLKYNTEMYNSSVQSMEHIANLFWWHECHTNDKNAYLERVRRKCEYYILKRGMVELYLWCSKQINTWVDVKYIFIKLVNHKRYRDCKLVLEYARDVINNDLIVCLVDAYDQSIGRGEFLKLLKYWDLEVDVDEVYYCSANKFMKIEYNNMTYVCYPENCDYPLYEINWWHIRLYKCPLYKRADWVGRNRYVVD